MTPMESFLQELNEQANVLAAKHSLVSKFDTCGGKIIGAHYPPDGGLAIGFAAYFNGYFEKQRIQAEASAKRKQRSKWIRIWRILTSAGQ